MLRGVGYAIFACFLWGFIFVIPNWITGYSPIEIVLGRYLTYGIISFFLLFRKGPGKARQFPPKAWLMAFIFALCSNILYYLGIVAGLVLASPSVTVVIAGLAPIVVALYGNWHVREISYTRMILPCLWVLAGLILVNLSDLMQTETTSAIQSYIVGVSSAVGALVVWSLYAVHNARFIKRNPGLPTEDWVSVIGIATFICSILVLIACLSLGDGIIDLNRFTTWSTDLQRYLIGVGILGFLASWLAFYLWNQAGLYLPVSLLGALVIFEPLFGMVFVYIFEWKLPGWKEILGVLLMISGTLYALDQFKRHGYKAPLPAQENES